MDNKIPSNIFISGITNISEKQFMEFYYPILDFIVKQEEDPIIEMSDDDGVALLSQLYFKSVLDKLKNGQIIIFGLGEQPKNFVSEKYIYIGGFTSVEERDAAMTYTTNRDVHIILEGEEKQTVIDNIIRRNTPLYDFNRFIKNGNHYFWDEIEKQKQTDKKKLIEFNNV